VRTDHDIPTPQTINYLNLKPYTEKYSDHPCTSSGLRFAGEVYPGEMAGWGAHLYSVEGTFEDVFAGGGGLPMYSGGEERDTHPWMERERERVKETGMGTWSQMLREFEGGGSRLRGAVIRDTREGESKRARERERLCTGLEYKCGSAEEGPGGADDQNPLSFSVPPPLLEVNEEAKRDEGVREGSDLSWLVGLGNV